MRASLLARFVATLCLLTACSDAPSRIEVHLFTGLVPGAEFRTVETTLIGGSFAGSAGHVLDSNEAVARLGTDYARGQQAAAFDVSDGSYQIRVRLLRPTGTFLVERVMAVSVHGNVVLPLHITRDCVGVDCPVPGGSAALSTCLQGRCVDPRCSPDAPEFCPEILFCNELSECGAVSECAEQTCARGVCTPGSATDACDTTQWCNPDVGAGCEPLTPVPTEDGIVCGTICVSPSDPCRFGYWDCSVTDAPVCAALQSRPIGHVCAAGRVCDEAADCVVPVTTPPSVVVDPTAGLVTNESGTTATFTVALTTRPTADVTIALSSSNEGEGTVSPPSVTLTVEDWATAHVVTVTGADDAVADGNASYTIVTAAAVSTDEDYNGFDAADVSAVNSDDETPGVTVSRTSGLHTSEDGSSDTFDITLNAAPSAGVTITVASDNASEGTVSPSTLTFTAADFAMPHTVTVTGVDDAVVDGDQGFTVVTSATASADAVYNGLAVDDATATNADDDVASVVVTPTSGLLTSEVGGTASFTLVLTSQPTANVTIGLTSTNVLEGTVAPASVTFTSSNWASAQMVTVTGVDDGVIDGRTAYTVVTAATSADANYNGLAVDDVAVGNNGVIPREYVKPTTIGAGDIFGTIAVSGDGDTMVVGAGREDSAATGINGDGTDNSRMDSGAAFIFVRSGSTWVQQAYLKQSNTGMGDYFGDFVGISSDGNTVAVSATSESSNATGVNGDQSNDIGTWSGAVYVFTRTGTTWTQQAFVKASNTGTTDAFGLNLSLAADGDTLVVTGREEDSNATGINGDQSNNLATASGAAYVFTRSAGVWSQQAYIKASNAAAQDWFGYDTAISADGNTVVVGAPEEDSSAVGINGDQSSNAATGSGAAYVFTRAAGVWTQQAYVKASNTGGTDRFGTAVGLGADGNTLAIGAHYEGSNATGVGGDQTNNAAAYSGAVYVFTRISGSWSQDAYIKASNARTNGFFGNDLAFSADANTLAVASWGEGSNATGIDGDQSNNTAPFSGAAYLFTRSAGVWAQQAYIKASNTDAYDFFGYSISLSADGRLLGVAAGQEDSGAVGIDGSITDNSAMNAGAVYLFRL